MKTTRTRFHSYVMLLTAVLPLASNVAAQPQPPAWMTEGPYVNAEAFSFALPMKTVAGKLYVEIELGGKQRQFVFDTGSPSMVSRDLAEELELKVVDKRKGRDSHGAIVESQIVQAAITLGDVTFNKVPLFSADFGSSLATRCLIGDGILGSEILPLCAWQIDKQEGVLRCHTDLKALDHIKDADRQTLYDFGYPHAPFLDIQLAEDARSKAMFDTGSPSYLALSPPDFEGTKKSDGLADTTRGYGSLGGSLGGQAPAKNQLRGKLKSFSVGDLKLGSLTAHVREAPPSLLGAPLLDHFVLTLDHRSNSAFFSPINEGPFQRPSFGFALGLIDAITMSLVWENSPAAEANLPAGTPLTSINGAMPEYSCSGILGALEALSADTIDLEWEGGAARLQRR